MSKKKITVGVDIGGTNTAYGFIGPDGEELLNGHFPSRADEPAEKLVARLADAFGVGWASHVSVSTELHNVAGLHIGAATANFLVSEYPYRFAEGPFGRNLTPSMRAPVDGWVEVGEDPGLGVEVDEDAVENLTVARQVTSLE